MVVHSGDADIAYEVLGKGPPLVLLHPFPANREFWRPAAELLTNRFQLILPDLRGHGDSGVGGGPATMQKHAADLLRVCDAAGIRKATFAGASIGGYVLMEFWRRHRERVARLVLADTRAPADTEEARASRLKSAQDVQKNGPEPFIASMIPKLIGQTTRTNRPDLVESAGKMMMRMTVDGIAAVQQGMAARPDSVPTLKTINVPVLAMVGDEDVLTPPLDAELIRQNIAGSSLRVIPRAGHYALFEQHEAAVTVMREFLGN